MKEGVAVNYNDHGTPPAVVRVMLTSHEDDFQRSRIGPTERTRKKGTWCEAKFPFKMPSSAPCRNGIP